MNQIRKRNQKNTSHNPLTKSKNCLKIKTTTKVNYLKQRKTFYKRRTITEKKIGN